MPPEEQTIELPITTLLPGIDSCQDGCLVRLEKDLQNRPGIRRAHILAEASPAKLCLHYDPNQLSGERVRSLAERAGNGITSRYHHKKISLEGMDCSDCALVLEHSLGRLEGVLGVNVDYGSGSMQIEYDSHLVGQTEIRRRVRQLGYTPEDGRLLHWYKENRELLFSLLAGTLLLAAWFGLGAGGLSVVFLPPAAGLGLYLAAYLLGGYDIGRHTLRALRQRHFDTDVLMLLAALGAASLGELAEGVLLLFLFSLGHALEERVVERARQAVRLLGELTPATALVRSEQGDRQAPVAKVQIGDLVLVPPGVRIPVDGQVAAGISAVDQSPVTGESLPVEKSPGEQVYAGTVNGQGALEVCVTRLAKDSTLSRVMALVEQAQEQQSPTQQVTEHFTRLFVPAVLVVDVLLIVIPPLFGVPFADSFRRAMTLLVAASPCALAIGTPTAVLAGIAQAARNGVLVKGGAHLENLGRLKALAFDKTGTLTLGKPQVTEVVAAQPGTENEILGVAAALEGHSAHPLARALATYALRSAQTAGWQIPVAQEVEAQTGLGVTGRVNGLPAWAGSRAMADERSEAGLPIVLAERLQELEADGKTVVLIGRGEQVLGLIGLADIVRPNAGQALQALRAAGVAKMVMLTGDRPAAAGRIAAQLGLSDYRAGLMPEDKVTVIQELVSEYDLVGMVGDGVNDAPALALSSVGIAMGGSSTDVALETADVALMSADLSRLSYAIGLGRYTRSIIVQNLTIALGVILFLGIFAVTGLAGIGITVFIHEGSTLVVALNALRVLGFKGRPG